jgi:hypothetical protein
MWLQVGTAAGGSVASFYAFNAGESFDSANGDVTTDASLADAYLLLPILKQTAPPFLDIFGF